MKAPRQLTREPSRHGRRRLSAAAVTAAHARQAREDAANPPEGTLSLIGAIRVLAPLITERKRRNWSDAMLVEFLSKLGVEITVETLRVYRGRLAQERGEPAPEQVLATEPSQPTASMSEEFGAETTDLDRMPEPQRSATGTSTANEADEKAGADCRRRFSPLVNLDEDI